ncbi:MAG: ribonuclease Y, partial [Calditrichia bacterium]
AEKEGVKIAQSVINNARLEAKRKAKDILVQAIQQISPDQSVEATISVINLPSDDMKGRIIGREGRNIRSFELVTGVDVIIDDTPEIVVLSCYDSYRREIARQALEKLISDGRIHPARIEEVYEKTSLEMKESLKEIGEQALLELGIHGVHAEITELLGKLQYRLSQGQNLLSHSIEVARLAGIMAAELELEVPLAKRAGMLHDIGKALDNYTESDHATLGAELLRKYNENEKVINAVEFHHSEAKATSPITLLVAAANTISGRRPGARRESLESFIKRMRHFEELSESFEGVKKSYALQAGRELRIIVDTEEIDDNRARELARAIAKKVLEEIEVSSPVKVTVIREYRSYDYAT